MGIDNLAVKAKDGYKKYFSKPLSRINERCKHTPTCPQHTIQVIIKYWFVKGTAMEAYMILRRNPFFKGVDTALLNKMIK